MIKDHHIETCRKLATLMEQKGVKWEWEVGDFYSWNNGDESGLDVIGFGDFEGNQTIKDSRVELGEVWVPIPTFTRCVEVLREWGWKYWTIVTVPSKTAPPVEMELFCSKEDIEKGRNSLFITAQDPDHAGQLALLEAVERMEDK